MSISRADVEHLAKLARMALNEDELDHFAAQLDVILGAVARVNEMDLADVPPTSHAIPMSNVFREDVRGESLTSSQALAASPAVEDDRFRVPRILDES